MTWSPIREAVVEYAERFEGLVGPDMASLCGLAGAWEEALHVPFRLVGGHTRGLSTCGLVAEGIWWRAGIDIPLDWRPYTPHAEIEKAIARAHQFAYDCGALVIPDGTNEPLPGDYACIGEGFRTHAMTIIDLDGGTIESIDGGQVADNGLQAIKRVRRSWMQRGGHAYIGDRIVQWWVDIDMLPVR